MSEYIPFARPDTQPTAPPTAHDRQGCLHTAASDEPAAHVGGRRSDSRRAAGMAGSITLFTVAGIDIRMHLTFPLILLWAALQFGLFLAKMPPAAYGRLIPPSALPHTRPVRSE